MLVFTSSFRFARRAVQAPVKYRQMCSISDPVIKVETTELSRLEIRVGKIIEIGKHPLADNCKTFTLLS